MWLSGLKVLEYFPELEEEKERRGRGGSLISFTSVGANINRDKATVKKWIDAVKAAGKTEERENPSRLHVDVAPSKEAIFQGIQVPLRPRTLQFGTFTRDVFQAPWRYQPNQVVIINQPLSRVII